MKFIPKYVVYLLLMYLAGLIFFTLFRMTLYFTELQQLDVIPPSERSFIIMQAFLLGFHFDTQICSYILIIPFLLFTISNAVRWEKRWLDLILSIFIIALYILGFLICAIDIPYFKETFSRVTNVIFNWTDDANVVFKMIYQEPRFCIYFFMFLIIAFLFTFISIKIRKHILDKYPFNYTTKKWKHYLKCLCVFIVSSGIFFLGIRGTNIAPIREIDACFSDYSFPNQLCLNPVFTFVQSYRQKINVIDDSLAMANAQRYLNVTPGNPHFQSPIAREIKPDTLPTRANIVVVIMESMSAEKMTRFGNKNNLTPNLDSIAHHAYCFDNFYSAGKHTSNGIYSTLFSFPALWNQRPTKLVVRSKYSGFSGTLRNYGYQTIFFATHAATFDNIGEFIPYNYFDQLVSQSDYPAEKTVGAYGVPDDFMFDFSIPKLNQLYEKNRPFFATLLTTSDHAPFIIPKDIPFKPHTSELKQQIVEYADWAIGKFLKKASEQKWFNNTIFIFTGDHGAIVGNSVYDIPLSYHHIPLIIYSPSLIPTPKVFTQMGGQIDIFPTIMGLLNIHYVNNTLGIDLLREKRPYIYFSADDKIGCVNQQWLYIYKKNGIESLYKYRNSDTRNYIDILKSKADSMKTYTFSMLQTAQWLISNKKTGIEQVTK